MNNKIIMLGTGSAMVTKCYNTCFVLLSNNESFLVDAGGGNGILAQIEKSGLAWNSIKNMFVTHSHTDHIIGVVWVVRKISSLMLEDKYDGDFNIYCHDECVNTIYSLCNLTLAPKFYNNIGKRIFINEIKNEDSLNTQNFSFTFFDIHSDKTKQFGFKVQLNNGISIACLGDEPFNEKCREYVENCDFLMCEAFCLYSQRNIFKPYEKFHSTCIEAGTTAKTLGVKNLILFHTEDKTLNTRKVDYTAEASSVFNGNIIIPDDLEVIDLKN